MTERLHFHFSLSCIGERNGNPLQYSCLENPRDGGALRAAVYGVAQSRTRLKRLSSSSRGTRDQIANICWIIEKSNRVPEKHLLLLYWLHQSLWPSGSQQTVENYSRDGNTRPPDLPPKKPICRSGSNGLTGHGTNRLVPNKKRSMSRLYIVTLLI